MPERGQPLHTIQPAFSRGEVSPFLFGRVDLAGWSQGLRTLRNATVRPEGSVSNRQGFNFNATSVTNTPKASILVPFIFSVTQSYLLEIGAGTAQVLSQGAVVASTSVAITGAFIGFFSHPNGYRIEYATAAPHGLSAGQTVTISGVVGTGSFAVANGSWSVISVVDATHFTVASLFGPSGAYTSGGSAFATLTFSTPWAAQDLQTLRWSQSADTLTLVHPKYPPYEIKRTSATSFTCLPAVYVNGPFLQQNADGTTFVFANLKSGTVTLTASAPIFNANHVGALFQLTQQDLSVCPPWSPSKQFAGNVSGPATAFGQYRRSNLKNYLSVSSVTALTGANEVCTGDTAPSHSQGVAADGDGNNVPNLGFCGINWEYQDSGSGIVKITVFTDSQHVTGVVQPNYTGGPGLLPQSVVGGPQVSHGPYNFTGDGVTTSFGPLTGSTTVDPSQFYVTVGGLYVAPSLYTITALAGNILFLTAPANVAAIAVSQISKLGQTTFWAFGAFSVDQGYPSAVSYFPDRLVLAGTPKQPVGVFASKTSLYHDFGVSNPVIASDGMAVFLNARQLNAISDLIPLSDLLIGTSSILWRLWPGSTGTALSPLAVAATPQNYYGESPSCAAALFGDSAIFSEFDGRRLRDLIYTFMYDKFMGQELTLYSRHLIPFGVSFQRIAYKPDPTGQLVFGVLSNGSLICCTYLREQQIIGWGHFDTLGTFEDICVLPEEGRYDLYAIINRTVNGATVRYIEQMEAREVNTIFDYQFLDCNSTYDGRNTSAVTMTLTGGTTWAAGDTGLLTASASSGWVNFFASDVGNEIWIYAPLTFSYSVGGLTNGVLTVAVPPGIYQVMFSDGETRSATVALDGVSISWQNPIAVGSILTCTVQSRLSITAFVSATQVSVRFKDPVPPMSQGVATATWTFARTTFTGAAQIAGQSAVALADACVIGMKPSGVAADGTLVVGGDGSVTMPRACGVVQLGLPYLSDFETLPLNEQGMETIRERAKTAPVIYLDVTETRNFLAGTSFAAMRPHVERAYESYVAPTSIQQGVIWTRVVADLDAECHHCIRQNMPLPITIRAVIPTIGLGEEIS